MTMNIRKALLSATCALCACVIALAGETDALRTKAARYVAQGEWLNASAIYWLILDRTPDDTNIYADAMVCNTLAGDTTAAISLTHNAMDNLVNADTLFSRIRTRAFALGHPGIYQDLLVRARENFPWMTRMVDRSLLEYYDYRNNGAQMMAYADKMLQGFPENVTYLRVKARGTLLCGDGDEAAEIWRHILDLAPDNYDTLVDLAAYLVTCGKRDAATPYIRRAIAIRPTPYLQSLLDKH